MKTKYKHPVPPEYHEILFIGGTDRRGNIVDFNIPPIILELDNLSIESYREKIFNNHIDIKDIPLRYTNPLPFLVLRPTGLSYFGYVREMLRKHKISIREEFLIDNFMSFSDIIYDLNPEIPFHYQWRIIMHSLHEKGFQNQNYAYIFLLDEKKVGTINHSLIMNFKKEVRLALGELPVVIKNNDIPAIGLGIHHLHAPDFNRIQIEYNTLMHAKFKTSIFKR